MPDGAVIIAAITSCTNTSNPRNVVAAGLLAKKANELGLVRKPWVKTSFAPGSKVAKLYLEEAGLLPELEKLGFGIVAYACTTCNGMSGALDPAIQKEIIERDLYATAVLSGNRNFDGRIHPYAKQMCIRDSRHPPRAQAQQPLRQLRPVRVRSARGGEPVPP